MWHLLAMKTEYDASVACKFWCKSKISERKWEVAVVVLQKAWREIVLQRTIMSV